MLFSSFSLEKPNLTERSNLSNTKNFFLLFFVSLSRERKFETKRNKNKKIGSTRKRPRFVISVFFGVRTDTEIQKRLRQLLFVGIGAKNSERALSLPLSLFLSLSPSLSFSCVATTKEDQRMTYTPTSRSLSVSLSLTHTVSLCSLHANTHTLGLTQVHAHARTNTHTLSLALSLAHFSYLFFSFYTVQRPRNRPMAKKRKGALRRSAENEIIEKEVFNSSWTLSNQSLRN